MDARTGRRQKKISTRQERRAAEDVGGRTQPASGALPEAGGDVRKRGELRIECKYTDNDFYVLELATLEKVKLQAIKGGLEAPVLQIGFRDRFGRLDLYAVIPWDPRKPRPALCIETTAKSTRLQQAYLRLALVDNYDVVGGGTRRLQQKAVMMVRFLPKADFEIMHWQDYLNQEES